jgi:hypothetical protein
MNTQRYHATMDATRTKLAATFETLDDKDLATVGKSALIEFGAEHIEPQPTRYAKKHGNWGQDWHEIKMLGVFASGRTLVECLRNWTKCAVRVHEYIDTVERCA